MAENYLDSAKQNSNWLSPTDALTQFEPLASEVTTAESPSARPESVFGFRVGSFGFLVASQTYCEVIEQLPVNPLPNVEEWFNGLLNLRGNLVPVIDLRLLLGESEKTDTKKRQLFAIGQGDKTMAFWIDGLPEIQKVLGLPLKQLPPLPAMLQHCVSNAYLRDGQLWFNVQFDELFKTLGRRYAMEEAAS
jgi:twitching motility protein PilI